MSAIFSATLASTFRAVSVLKYTFGYYLRIRCLLNIRETEHVVPKLKGNTRRQSEAITRRPSRDLNIYPSYLPEVHLHRITCA